MDVFSRTFHPAATEAGIPITVISRHLPVLRACVAPEDSTLLVAQCQRPGQPVAGSFLLLLTNRHLVITRESRLTRRAQLHLVALLRDLSQVAWVPDGRFQAVELAATTSGGVRERFWLPVRGPHRVAHVDALFSHAFRSSTSTGWPGPTRRSGPAGGRAGFRPRRPASPAPGLAKSGLAKPGLVGPGLVGPGLVKPGLVGPVGAG